MPPAPRAFRGHIGRRIALRDLEASFLRIVGEVSWSEIPKLEDAHGIYFLCPKCFTANGGPRGTHRVICWFRGCVPDELTPKPGRWTPGGRGLDDLTFVPGVPAMAVSVQLQGACWWHGHVRQGAVVSDA
jgi:hypothetical protein